LSTPVLYLFDLIPLPVVVIVWMHGMVWHGRLARKSWGLGIPFGWALLWPCMMIKDVLWQFDCCFSAAAAALYIYYFMLLREQCRAEHGGDYFVCLFVCLSA
jgi:hypothetical protein